MSIATDYSWADRRNHMFYVDVDQAKNDLLNSGGVLTNEISLKKVIEHKVEGSRRTFSADAVASLTHTNMRLIAVGSPPFLFDLKLWQFSYFCKFVGL